MVLAAVGYVLCFRWPDPKEPVLKSLFSACVTLPNYIHTYIHMEYVHTDTYIHAFAFTRSVVSSGRIVIGVRLQMRSMECIWWNVQLCLLQYGQSYGMLAVRYGMKPVVQVHGLSMVMSAVNMYYAYTGPARKSLC